MIFEHQKKSRDCFPTCFSNAMLYFGIPIVQSISKRLEVFNNGTENCTIYSSEEKLEQYERSIHKFISEWNWACDHKDDKDYIYPKVENWATYLLGKGVHLEFKNGPIEQRRLITNALANHKLIICETLEPSASIPNTEAKHFVLIVKLLDNKLFIHDPLSLNRVITSEKLKYNLDECGSNLEIDRDYFFSNETGPIKPKPNQYQTDWGYKFILISRLVKESK
jgi:hypothetical protein